jgi:hypothetical protein
MKKLEGSRGVRYKASYRATDGRIHSMTWKRKADATNWLENSESDKNRGQWIDPSAGRTTLQALNDELHAVKAYAPATVSLHRALWNGVPHRAKNTAIANLSRHDIDLLLRHIDKPGKRDKTRQLLSALYNFAIREGKYHINPAERRASALTRLEKMNQNGAAERPKRYLTEDELTGLRTESPKGTPCWSS